MATPYGIEFGNVLNAQRAGEQHKMQKQLFQQDQEDRTAARARNVFMQGARAAAVNREPGAMAQLVTMDPAQAKQISDYLASADETEAKRLEEQNDIAGRMAAVVLSSSDPAQSYDTYRGSLPPEMQQSMPEEYDETFMRFQLARAQEVSDIMKNPEKITIGTEDRLYQNGRVVDSARSQNALNMDMGQDYTLSPGSVRMRGDTPIAENPRMDQGGSANAMNASDENAMFRQSVELLGGLFDANGNIQALDPQLRGRAQAIATEATNLFRQGGMTRTQAVTTAAEMLGQTIPRPTGGAPGMGAPRPVPRQTQQPVAQPAPQTQYTEQNPAQPMDANQYNALPSGAVFRDPQDGQLYRKP